MNEGTPLTKVFSFYMIFVDNNAILRLTNTRHGYTHKKVVDKSLIKTLSLFTDIYTDMLKKSLEELKDGVNINSNVTSSFLVY
jgi:hypothetical protein